MTHDRGLEIAAKRESHLRDLVRDFVVLRERNLTTNAHE